MRKLLGDARVLVLALVLVLGLAVGALALLRGEGSDLRRAVEMVPAKSLRVSFTDWAAVRKAAGLAATSDPEQIATLVQEAFDLDLSSASNLQAAAVAIQENFGFSPGQAEWEAYAQSRAGAAVVLKMPDDFDFDQLRENLASAGYQRPKSDEGVWEGGIDVTAALDPNLPNDLQHITLLEDQDAIVTSDNLEYAGTAAKVARGEADSLGGLDSATSMVEAVGSPASAVLWSRDFACDDLSMASASEVDRERARELVEDAGEVSPLSGLLMAMSPGRSLTVVQAFASDEQARANLEPRASLAVGEAVGRGGSFSDDFELTSSRTEGELVLLRLEPVDDTTYVLSALSSGPVIFATC